MLKAVLFDFDGVLVNSMSFHVLAWQNVFSEFDITVQPEDVLLREGCRSIELAKMIFDENDINLPEAVLKEFVDKKQRKYREITRARLYDSVQSILNKIKKDGLQIGLVTGSTRENVDKMLSPGVAFLFDTFITGDDVKIGKPNPECYLKAARSLNVEPAECVVIENAPLGIQAGQNAGMRVVALTTTLDRDKLNGADFYAKDLHDLSLCWERIAKTELVKIH